MFARAYSLKCFKLFYPNFHNKTSEKRFSIFLARKFNTYFARFARNFVKWDFDFSRKCGVFLISSKRREVFFEAVEVEALTLLFWKRIGDHQAEAQFALCTTREECKIVKITDKEANAGDLEVKWWWVQLNFRRQQASIVFAFQFFAFFVVFCRFCFYVSFHWNYETLYQILIHWRSRTLT